MRSLHPDRQHPLGEASSGQIMLYEATQIGNLLQAQTRLMAEMVMRVSRLCFHMQKWHALSTDVPAALRGTVDVGGIGGRQRGHMPLRVSVLV